MAEHHHLVHLQAGLFDPPHQFAAPPGITLTQEHHPTTTPEQLHDRIRDATIIVLSYTRIDAEALSEAVSPRLKLIAVTAVGTDSVDLEACRKRGIRVTNCPGSNVEAVSNHVMALYFAARRNIVRMDRATKIGTWVKFRSSLSDGMADRDGNWCLTCDEEVMGILGYGYVGKRVAQMAQALGMKVLVAGRKGEESPPTNVSRGGIVDEAALLQALKDRTIHGAATDVFTIEPASAETSPLLAEGVDELNLTASPHLAWNADKTAKNYARMSPENVMNFLLGHPTNIVV